MSRDSSSFLTFEDRMKIIQGRHLFAYYVQKQQQNKNGTNTNPLNLYPLDNESSAYTTMKIGAVNTTLAEYNKYVAAVAASSTPTVRNTPPSSPTISSIVIGNGVITVYFDIPSSDGGSAINDYEYSIDDGATWTFSGSKTSPIEITGLTNGVEYSVKLRAVNSVGSGEAYSPVSGTPATVPDAPSFNFDFDLPGDGYLIMHFNTFNNGGSEIINYEYSLDLGTIIFPLNTTISPYTITGLTNGVNYYFQLRAKNAIGYSEWAYPTINPWTSDIYARPGRIPDAPTNLNVTAGDGSASISFDAGYDGGYMVLSYEYSINNGPVIRIYVNYNSFEITGLTNGVSYSIKVRAENILGSGAWSSPIDVTPVAPAPSGTVFAAPAWDRTTSSTMSPFSSGGNSYSFNGTITSYILIEKDDYSYNFGTGDFTIEWFQYQTDNNAFTRIISNSMSANENFSCYFVNSTEFNTKTVSNNSFGNVTPYKNQWVHFAVVRNSGILQVYKNGIQQGSNISNTDNISVTNRLTIGGSGTAELNTMFAGNMTNIRIVKGLAVYTGSFTVPTSALTLTTSENPYGGSNTVAIPDGYTKLLLVP